MAILHLVRCDSCASDTPLGVSLGASTGTISLNGRAVPQTGPASFSVPLKIKQVDGKYLCSWSCVAEYAGKQAKQ